MQLSLRDDDGGSGSRVLSNQSKKSSLTSFKGY